MDDLISRQAAIEAIHEDADWLAAQGSDWQVERMERDKSILKSLPTVQPNHDAEPGKMVDDTVSRQAAMERLMAQNVIMDGSEYHNGFNAGVNRTQEVIRNLPPIQPKNGTLIIPLNESDFKSVKRIMLDNKPWCRMFYEDVPGEAHWIKKYTPDDGEVYECDNCGVTWQFNDGGPEENEAFYCPKCGFKMERGEEDGRTD